MEVAVLKSLISVQIGLLAACLLGGCADVVTFSQDFKREGLRQYNRGEFVDAAGSFKAAAKQDPTDYQTQYYLGLSYEKIGDFHSAVEAYKLCLALRPAMPAGRADVPMRERVTSRLAALIAHADFAEAEINSIQAKADAEHSPDDYRLLARIFALRGDADSAVDNYRRAVSYAQDDFVLTKEYAFYLLKINQTAEGTRVLKIAWQLYPNDRQVVQTLRELGVTDAQLVVSSTAIENQPTASASPQSAWDDATSPRD
jgi:Tfp pilus assembly protein PilF